uniref:Uncharacterized protein n=1 Tax=Rhabditophanes sp. KR3021 TaxID=114890 RepID=A0AC35TTT1_9BILA
MSKKSSILSDTIISEPRSNKGIDFYLQGIESEGGNKNSFDKYCDKYLCCCKSFRALTGVKLLALFLSTSSFVITIRFIQELINRKGKNTDEVQATFLKLLIVIPVSVSMTVSLSRKSAGCLVPFLTLQIVGFVTGIIQAIALIYYIFVTTENNAARSLCTLIFYVFIVMIQLWFISIVVSCWKYFNDRRLHKRKNAYTNFIPMRPPFDQIDFNLEAGLNNEKEIVKQSNTKMSIAKEEELTDTFESSIKL